ncbi:class F sortase [Blastococcus saxobsidens]|uniref:Sortase family protein n=1 Tax=Blastococcus saxobsidens TaxID=138336 RepID=A0A4Q7Y272_9ACTN|nr:sortase family protein [Blastococcus saxobsidens]
MLALMVAGLPACSGGTSTAAAPPSERSGEAPPSIAPASTMQRSAPVHLSIPAIGVDSGLMDLGLLDDGTLEVPPAGFPAGWYTGAPTPGELGPAIVAGHVDWEGAPGVFYELRSLVPGDEVVVTREDGRLAVFEVQRVEQFPKGEFPTEQVYGDLDHAGLRLITCGGSFDQAERSYEDNVVVFADLVGEGTA